MKEASPEVRTLRILGCLAVLHAATLVFVFFIPSDGYEWPAYPWMLRLWIVLATLWFIWPIVLALHRAQSARRVLVPLGFAAPFVFCWFNSLARDWGPQEFGLPEGMSLTPYSAAEYSVAYVRGFMDGARDAKSGRLILEAYGFGTFTPSTPNFCGQPDDEVRRCGIKFNHVTGCVVDTWILAHARSYNQVMMSKIREHCPALVKAAEDEATRDRQASEQGENDGRAEAEADLKSGRLAIVVDDPDRKDDVAFESWLRQKYGLGLKRVNPRADSKFDNKVSAYASAYNRVADQEITRRFGKVADYEIWEAWVKIPQENSLPH